MSMDVKVAEVAPVVASPTLPAIAEEEVQVTRLLGLHASKTSH